jgi:Flp pilus assembly protein TadG
MPNLTAVTRKRAARRGRDRGAAAVELALLLPILLLVVFAIIDFGRMMNAQIALTEAAREGARADAIGANGTTVAQQAALPSLGSLVPTSVSSSCGNATPGATSTNRVTMTYTFRFVTPLGMLGHLMPGGHNSGGYTTKTLTGVGVSACGA